MLSPGRFLHSLLFRYASIAKIGVNAPLLLRLELFIHNAIYIHDQRTERPVH